MMVGARRRRVRTRARRAASARRKPRARSGGLPPISNIAIGFITCDPSSMDTSVGMLASLQIHRSASLYRRWRDANFGSRGESAAGLHPTIGRAAWLSMQHLKPVRPSMRAMARTGKVAHSPNSPRTVVGDRVPCGRRSHGCPGSYLTSRSTIASDPTVGPPAEISAPEDLADSIGRSRRSGRFRSTSHAVSGAASTPRDRARDRDLQTVENARSTGPGEHPGIGRRPLQPVEARRNGRPNPARDGRLGALVGASSVIRRCSTLDLKSADAM